MDLTLVVPVLLSLLAASLGWYAVHRLSLRRTILDAKRTQRVEYLVCAYRALYDLACGGIRDRESFVAFRNALNDIHLFGTAEHIIIAQDVFTQIANTNGRAMNLGSLLAILQDDLRLELGLEHVDKYGKMLSWSGSD